jgi:hypothetical protein
MKLLMRSFAGGEIAPEMQGRTDLVAHQTGLALCRNAIVLPHGPVRSRPGTRFCAEARDSSRLVVLIPFIFSQTQALVLEFGHLYIRFYADGASVLETPIAITGATAASPCVVGAANTFTAGDRVFVTGVGGMTALNGRTLVVGAGVTGSAVPLNNLDGTPFPTVGSPAYTSGGTIARVYQVASPYTEGDLRALNYTQSNDVVTIVHPSYQQRELRRLGPTNWTLSTFTLAPSIAAPGTPTVAVGSGSGAINYTYVTTAVATETLEESAPSASATIANNLATAGNFNNITPAAVSGAVRYNVYKLVSGLFGYIGQTNGGAFRDDNITPNLNITPPLPEDPFVGAGNWPASVGYFGGRRWFGGTNNRGLGLWGTRSGTESNMTYSIPTQDDDRIAVRLTARQASVVRHLLPFDKLVALTSNAEWIIDTAGEDVLTPSSIFPRAQSYVGAAAVVPAITNVSVLFAQDRGGRVREMMYTDARAAYNSNDVCIMAPHLFDGFTVLSMAFATAPHPTLWVVRSDGVLLSLTYVPEQKIMGWAQHATDGVVESVTVIPEGNESIPYLVVRRTVGARTVRYIERMAERRVVPLAQHFGVDAGLSYSGAPVSTVTGLHHLNGRTVAILADGSVEPQQVVVNGSITLQNRPPASVIHIGLPFTVDIVTLPLASEAVEANGMATNKSITNVFLRVVSTGVFLAGTTQDSSLREAKVRSTEDYGTPPNLFTGVIEVMPNGAWEFDAAVRVQQPNPVPLTLAGLMPEVTRG